MATDPESVGNQSREECEEGIDRMPVDLDAIRKRHRGESVGGRAYCLVCGEITEPCDAIRLADEIERLREQMSQPRALLVESFQAACSENVELREALEKIAEPRCWNLFTGDCGHCNCCIARAAIRARGSDDD